MKHVELNTKTVSAVLITQTLKMIYYYINVNLAMGINKKSLMKNQTSNLLLHKNFLIMIVKVCTHMNTWMRKI